MESYSDMNKKELLIALKSQLDRIEEKINGYNLLPPAMTGYDNKKFVTSVSGPIKLAKSAPKSETGCCGGACGKEKK